MSYILDLVSAIFLVKCYQLIPPNIAANQAFFLWLLIGSHHKTRKTQSTSVNFLPNIKWIFQWIILCLKNKFYREHSVKWKELSKVIFKFYLYICIFCDRPWKYSYSHRTPLKEWDNKNTANIMIYPFASQ